MNADRPSVIDPETLELRKQFEHHYLRRLIKEVRNEELPIDDLVKCGRAYNDFIKSDATRDKNTAAADLYRAGLALPRLPARRLSDNPQSPRPSKSPSKSNKPSDLYDDEAP
jgi:hypothetical protein